VPVLLIGKLFFSSDILDRYLLEIEPSKTSWSLFDNNNITSNVLVTYFPCNITSFAVHFCFTKFRRNKKPFVT